MRLLLPIDPYVGGLAVSALACLILAARAWLGSKKDLAVNLALIETGVFVWCLFRIVMILLPAPEERFLAFRLQYLGIALIPGCAYCFARALDGRPLRGLALLLAHAVGAFGLLSAFTSHSNAFMWLSPSIGIAEREPATGIAYWLFLAGIFAEVGASLGIILRLARRMRGAMGRWMRLLAILIFLPFSTKLAYTFLPGVMGIADPTPFALALFGILLFAGLSRFNLLDSVPYTKEVILQTIEMPFLVTDSEGYVVGANEAARRAFRIGEAIAETSFPELFPELAGFVGGGEMRESSREGTHYLVSCFAVKRGPIMWRGRIYMFRDVSQLVEAGRAREAALEQAAAALAEAEAANAARAP